MILRGLVVFLCCLNLGVGLWWALQREKPVLLPPPVDTGVGSLVLLGEAGPPPTPEQADTAGIPVPVPADVECLTLGPFATPAEMRAAMGALAPHVARIEFREVAAGESRGWRVFLPAAGDREQALAAGRALAAKGVNDYYVVTGGADVNTVSLGAFRDLANAERRRDQIAALGFEPVLEARPAAAPVWWIDLASEPGLDWAALLPRREGVSAQALECR
ncbi:SPOR domain-containing protein [Arenimonas composti]|uniref:SPOR domain-containing protein n=1 Tax=Arenimonas composti TR7-09 = DSM 18010 TaxID=1121013 RepID=A0A091BC43_9GAMM|nr:SPOR domain-containing protein [Arenimonas composti]KFN50248.1 hypothetical protein P873_07780 [Arenimonas composti TR7-09 = DSM 18010]